MDDPKSTGARAKLEAELADAISILVRGTFTQAQLDDIALVLLAQLRAIAESGVGPREALSRLITLLGAITPTRIDRMQALDVLEGTVRLLLLKEK